MTPIVLGGDHSIALPKLRAAAAVYGPLSLVQFDSHPDTWDAYFGQKHTHGTPFRRALEEGLLRPERSIQVGMRGSIYDERDWDDAREMGFDLVPTDAVRKVGIEETIERIRERVDDAKVYISFAVDFVDPAFAPGTGRPEIGSFTSCEAQEFVRGLAGLSIVGCDVVEVYPAYDPAQINGPARRQHRARVPRADRSSKNQRRMTMIEDLYIGGEWRDSTTSGKTFDVTNPATGDVTPSLRCQLRGDATRHRRDYRSPPRRDRARDPLDSCANVRSI